MKNNQEAHDNTRTHAGNPNDARYGASKLQQQHEVGTPLDATSGQTLPTAQ